MNDRIGTQVPICDMRNVHADCHHQRDAG